MMSYLGIHKRLNRLPRTRSLMLRRLAFVIGLLIVPQICLAQTIPTDVVPQGQSTSPAPSPSPVPVINVSDSSQGPLTDRERAMLELIKNLQERVTKLEAAQVTAEKKETPQVSPAGPPAAVTTQDADRVSQASTPPP